MSTQYANMLRQRMYENNQMGGALMGGYMGGVMTEAEKDEIKAIRDANHQRNLKDGINVGLWEEGKDGKKRWVRGHISGEEYARRRALAKATRKVTSEANERYFLMAREAEAKKQGVERLTKLDQAILKAKVKAKTSSMARRAKADGKDLRSYLLNDGERASFVPKTIAKAAKPTTLAEYEARDRANAAKVKAAAKELREKKKIIPQDNLKLAKELREQANILTGKVKKMDIK